MRPVKNPKISGQQANFTVFGYLKIYSRQLKERRNIYAATICVEEGFTNSDLIFSFSGLRQGTSGPSRVCLDIRIYDDA